MAKPDSKNYNWKIMEVSDTTQLQRILDECEDAGFEIFSVVPAGRFDKCEYVVIARK